MVRSRNPPRGQMRKKKSKRRPNSKTSMNQTDQVNGAMVKNPLDFVLLHEDIRRPIMDFAIAAQAEEFQQIKHLIVPMRRVGNGLLVRMPEQEELARKFSAGALACVNREWQQAVEKHVFKSLTLHHYPDDVQSGRPLDIDMFWKTVNKGTRRNHITHLILDVAPSHGWKHSVYAGGDLRLASFVRRFFSIMAWWEPQNSSLDLVHLSLRLNKLGYGRFWTDYIGAGYMEKKRIIHSGVRDLRFVRGVSRFSIECDVPSIQIHQAYLALVSKLPNLSHVQFTQSGGWCEGHWAHAGPTSSTAFTLPIWAAQLQHKTHKQRNLKTLALSCPDLSLCGCHGTVSQQGQLKRQYSLEQETQLKAMAISLCDMSYQLEELFLNVPIDVCQFFHEFREAQYTPRRSDDFTLMSLSFKWPNLKKIRFIFADSLLANDDLVNANEKALMVAGAAMAHMPKLISLWISRVGMLGINSDYHMESLFGFGFQRGQFGGTHGFDASPEVDASWEMSGRLDSWKFNGHIEPSVKSYWHLSVAGHNPSKNVVARWKFSTRLTKREDRLLVELNPEEVEKWEIVDWADYAEEEAMYFMHQMTTF